MNESIQQHETHFHLKKTSIIKAGQKGVAMCWCFKINVHVSFNMSKWGYFCAIRLGRRGGGDGATTYSKNICLYNVQED
jgi:DNA polymerase/3'-5' exonuclease PolX